ncbi:MAG: hypothetical protein EBS05_07665 [Proteobacteria bacterium]|nr:hypothetical protein [Pseudomonadota bacterium]
MKSKQSVPKPTVPKAAAPKTTVPKPTIEAGQVWRMEGVTCHIGQVGKTLVNYKLLKGDTVRGPSSLGNKEVLLKHLKAKKAVLVKG